jgi:hypothetical protein
VLDELVTQIAAFGGAAADAATRAGDHDGLACDVSVVGHATHPAPVSPVGLPLVTGASPR